MWLGVHKEPNILVDQLRNLRRNGIINIYTSISWYIDINEIHIQTDGGRICRPLYIIKDNKFLMNDTIANELKDNKKEWHNLLVQNIGTKLPRIGENICFISFTVYTKKKL